MSTEFALHLLNEVLQSVLLVVLPAVVIFAIRYVKQEWKRLHLPAQLVFYADLAVHAAEQAHLGDLVKDKKVYAIEALQALLDSHGIKLDAKALDAAVENAVQDADLPHTTA